MSKFHFRLQSVLNYRSELEETAKSIYLAAQASRVELERTMVTTRVQRASVLANSAKDIISRLDLQNHVERLDSDESTMKSALNVLMDEEEAAKTRWLFARREHEVLRKLREKALEHWTAEESRLEQSALDEWAVLRR